MEEAPQPKQSPACGRMKQPVRRERQEVPLCTHDATESRSRGGPGVAREARIVSHDSGVRLRYRH